MALMFIKTMHMYPPKVSCKGAMVVAFFFDNLVRILLKSTVLFLDKYLDVGSGQRVTERTERKSN